MCSGQYIIDLRGALQVQRMILNIPIAHKYQSAKIWSFAKLHTQGNNWKAMQRYRNLLMIILEEDGDWRRAAVGVHVLKTDTDALCV